MKASIINLLLRSNTECLLLVKQNADKEVLHEERYTVKNFNELIRLFVFNYAKYVETTKININQYKSINKYSQQNMIKNIKKNIPNQPSTTDHQPTDHRPVRNLRTIKILKRRMQSTCNHPLHHAHIIIFLRMLLHAFLTKSFFCFQ